MVVRVVARSKSVVVATAAALLFFCAATRTTAVDGAASFTPTIATSSLLSRASRPPPCVLIGRITPTCGVGISIGGGDRSRRRAATTNDRRTFFVSRPSFLRAISSSSPLLSSKDADSIEASLTAHPAPIVHHAAVKTRNIENAINFYSLLGFRVETKFISGPARSAWLIHGGEEGGASSPLSSRIELLEVPSYMLNESEGTKCRAIDLAKREELLGWNHLALDVTGCMPRPDNDGGASADGTACALYQLQEWLDDLNETSLSRFGRALRVALPPTKRIVGKQVYEMAFLYDADGALVELLNHHSTLAQEVGDGWVPWDGRGFVS